MGKVNGVGLFIVGKEDFYVPVLRELFSDLETLAKEHLVSGFGGYELLAASGSDETGYFIVMAGGVNSTKRFYDSIRHTTDIGYFMPGIYILGDCMGGPILSPNDRVTFKEFMANPYIEERDFLIIERAFKIFLRNHKKGKYY